MRIKGLNIMRPRKMNVVIFQLQSNFKRLFYVWFDSEICCLTEKESLKLAIYRLSEKYTWEKVTKKSDQEKGKSTLLTFFYSMQ